MEGRKESANKAQQVINYLLFYFMGAPLLIHRTNIKAGRRADS